MWEQNKGLLSSWECSSHTHTHPRISFWEVTTCFWLGIGIWIFLCCCCCCCLNTTSYPRSQDLYEQLFGRLKACNRWQCVEEDEGEQVWLLGMDFSQFFNGCPLVVLPPAQLDGVCAHTHTHTPIHSLTHRRHPRKHRRVPQMLRHQRLFSPPLARWGGCLGRQGSLGRGSWEKTESSPEEQVELRVSGKLGEYWSNGRERSRYS